MPLRDHFRPPVSTCVSWEEIHGMWPARIVLQLRTVLPKGYVAGPKIHTGSQVETDVPDYDEYEVCIYDAERGRQLVAAIELVSPENKDRPQKRNAFVGKCAALLQKGVAVSIVDVVTPRQFNLYAELLDFLGQNDQTLGETLPHLYAASCRWRPLDKRMLLQTWSHTLRLDRPLPTLPAWLTEKLAVPLDQEQSYEQARHDLWLT
ncbi:MAG TPA: hypothetical protein VMG10_02100 [Gemmataceae bacterium]|nr:hypothetical protein [Gemmataceae bacterium]